jgi:hypothetical protein
MEWDAGALETSPKRRFDLRGREKADDQYTPEETARRRDEAIRRALNTPPKPQKEIAGKSGRSPRKRATHSRPIKKN